METRGSKKKTYPKVKFFEGDKIPLTEENQFTSWQRTRSACEGWYDWFKRGGIKVAVGNSPLGFAVFRTGQEVITDYE